MIISRRTTETKPGNHRFRPKSTKITGSGGPMGPALTNRPGIAKVFTYTCVPKSLRAADYAHAPFGYLQTNPQE